MDETENIRELRQEYNQKKKELSSLRSQLRNQNSEKEGYFRQLRSIRDKIRSRLVSINLFKEERDKATVEVKDLKKERDVLNDEVKQKSSLKKDVETKKKELGSVIFSQYEDPRKIKAQIDKLENALETEVINFSKEQQLRKTLKELKNKYKSLEGARKIFVEARAVESGFTNTRRKAQRIHKEIQEKAAISQEKHEKINSFYEEIKAFREEEKPLAENYLKLKKDYDTIKIHLEELQKRTDELSKLFEEDKEKSFAVKAKEKTDEVKDKIRRGKKLNTEDILAFQAIRD